MGQIGHQINFMLPKRTRFGNQTYLEASNTDDDSQKESTRNRINADLLPPPPSDDILNASFPVGNNTATFVGVNYDREVSTSLSTLKNEIFDTNGHHNPYNASGDEIPTFTILGSQDILCGSQQSVEQQSSLTTPQRTINYTNTTNLNNRTPSRPIPDSIQSNGSVNIRGLASAVNEIQNNQALVVAKLDMALDMLRTLLQQGPDNQLQSTCRGEINLPLNSVCDYQTLETCLLEDKKVKTDLICQLKNKGGDSHTIITYRIMTALMTDELMCSFTFAGATGKLSFKSSILLQCVCSAVRQNRKGSVATDKEVEKAVEYWLKKASTRIDIKMKRAEKRSVVDNHEDEDVDEGE